MNRRLQQFLTAENITQSVFADTIGVARASVSHILAGRNKPGFDFIESIGLHYPALNIEWLITGKGRMYKTAEAETRNTEPSVPVFTQVSPAIQAAAVAPLQARTGLQSSKVKNEVKERKIIKMTVFFDDGTYQDLTPAEQDEI